MNIKNHIGKHMDDESLYDMKEKSSPRVTKLVNELSFVIIAAAALGLAISLVWPRFVQ